MSEIYGRHQASRNEKCTFEAHKKNSKEGMNASSKAKYGEKWSLSVASKAEIYAPANVKFGEKWSCGRDSSFMRIAHGFSLVKLAF